MNSYENCTSKPTANMKIKVAVIHNSCKFSEETSAFTEMMAVAQETRV